MPKLRAAIKDNQLQEVPDSEIEYEHLSPNNHLGTHANLVPLQSAVSSGRVFYGARFANQALPLLKPEAPLVQLLSDTDPDGRSFDEILGDEAGNVRSKGEGTVREVTPDNITVHDNKGNVTVHDTYDQFPFNRKTLLTNHALVKPGDKVTPGHLLAHSNYTDPKGTLALGANLRVGIVPYKGHSMDDAIVISEGAAKRLTANNLYAHDMSYKRGVKGGKAHYTGLFTHKWVNAQLDKLDDDGVVKKGQILQPGDPLILATKPRVVSSASAQLGQLSKHMKNARNDASVLWDHDTPGTVLDVHRTRSGVKVNVSTDTPADVGDKLAFRSGAKAVISTIIPDEHMPRTADGMPLEVLLNPQSVPSRMNPSLPYEIMLGKVARKTGKPYKLPSALPPGMKWYDYVAAELKKNGLKDTETVFDPQMNRQLENPITVGEAHMLRLHHTSASKVSSRGTGGYNSDAQPQHGGSEAGQSKRLSGLESHCLLSSGAYNILREGATLRGTRNDQFWRELRQGYEPKEPGTPFIWEKFKALLQGAGYHARKMGNGVERLQFLTDADLLKHRPIKVHTGDIVNMADMTPIRGGLFDPALTGANAWGKIDLPHTIPNPAAQDVICKLLGITEAKFRKVLAGEETLEDAEK